MRVGILGAGSIAGTLSRTINGLNDPNIVLYAVGARDLERAKKFAAEYKIEKAYGSYEELVSDKDVDLIYVATPHSHHYQHTKLAVEHGKNCLVEKAFMANAKQAKEILDLAKEKKVLVTEAIWTRYMPSRRVIDSIIKSGEIGPVHAVQANLGYPLAHVERLVKPELAGGALLDIGGYATAFARMFLNEQPEVTLTTVKFFETGVDEQSGIILKNSQEQLAVMALSMRAKQPKRGVISGTRGYVEINNYPRATEAKVTYTLDAHTENHETITAGDSAKALNYEVMDMQRYISQGHDDGQLSLSQDVAHILNRVRANWGMNYTK